MKRSTKTKPDETPMININSPPFNVNNVNSNSSESSLIISTPRDLGQLFYALGDIEGNTMEIIALLISKGPKTVTEISNHIGKSDSATSQRLSKLRLQGFVTQRSENTTRIYSVNPDIKNIVNTVNQVFQTGG